MNRFECRVCPYEAPLEKNYFEKKDMKQKEVDDVFGGKEEFANADSVGSKFFLLSSLRSDMSVEIYRANILSFFSFPYSSMPRRKLQWGTCVLLPAADSQCR